MVSARNDLQIQLLGEADFGSVEAMDGDAFKDGEEFATKLLVAFFGNGVSVTHAASALRGDGFVHGSHQSDLLCGRSVDEILAEEFIALFVDAGKTGEKILAFFIDGPFGKDDVNEFIDARGLGARSVRCGKDKVDHGDYRVILMRVEGAQRVPRGGVRTVEKSKKIGEKLRQP